LGNYAEKRGKKEGLKVNAGRTRTEKDGRHPARRRRKHQKKAWHSWGGTEKKMSGATA